jgi:predicted alpha/beta hydrolase
MRSAIEGGMLMHRQKVMFPSGGTQCAAWHYAGTNGACVIMAGGFAATRKPGTDLFAQCFHEAGFSVLAIDYRCLVESRGKPRQVVRIGDQLADWQAAIEFAASLAGVDPARLAAWGLSVSGGHMFRIAASNPRLVPSRSCPGGLRERREPRSASARDRSYQRQGQA